MTTVRLPLLPLDSVLFPGLVLPLHVSEERYRAMMRELLKTPEDEPRRFAVVAIRDGHEVAPSAPVMPDPTVLLNRGPAAGFGPDPAKSFHATGCVADAATIRERADGTFEVLATGTTRVRLLSVDSSGPYLTADLEELPEDPGEEAGALAEGVLRAFRQYQKRLARARERSLSTGADLPGEPSVVSYLVAAAMMLDTPTKQRLLQAPDTASRLRDELELLRTASIMGLGGGTKASHPASERVESAPQAEHAHEPLRAEEIEVVAHAAEETIEHTMARLFMRLGPPPDPTETDCTPAGSSGGGAQQ